MQGGDLTVHAARMQNVGRSSDRMIIKNPNSHNLNFFWTYTLLLNLAIGSDQMFIPYCFMGGILITILIAFGLALLTMLSFWIYTSSWQYSTAVDFVSTWEFLYGHRFKNFPAILIILSYVSIASSYSNEMWDEMACLIRQKAPNAPEGLLSPWTLSYVMTFISLILSIWCKSFADLRYISLFSNTCMFGVMLVAIAIMGINIIYGGWNPYDNLKLWENEVSAPTTDYCLATYAAIYFLHPLYYFIINEMANPTFKRILTLNTAITVTSFTSTMITGLAGYFSLWVWNMIRIS